MTSRRDFLKHAGLLAGGTMVLSDSIRRAFAIDPAPGTTWADAEHVVILMQENRSFDHVYGTLRGVRGFDDPRAIQLPNGNPVWLQTNKKGETFAPFRLNIKETNVTWLGSLPHSWTDQTDANNRGKHDRWLDAKQSGHKECAGMPFTLGTYVREDLQFYYDLADAFTICDQHFCSSLTGTMPNRLYLWSGTIRGVNDASARARVNNGDVEYEDSCHWKTFPDRLEEAGVSWKVYQNEISSVDVGLNSDEAPWLENYGDNPLEWFPQFHTGFAKEHQKQLDHLIATLPDEIEDLKSRLAASPSSVELRDLSTKKTRSLAVAKERRARFSPENFEKLSQHEKNLHAKALCNNSGDPDYHRLSELRFRDGDVERTMTLPKGDVLHQFRADVAAGKLPAVSWIVAPENFSDHPSSAWFGAWYLSEVINILTQNPEVWRKTIFLLTYDENDGYFDHIPPFLAPDPRQPQTGVVSEGMKTDEDFVTMEEELKTKKPSSARENSIGLGFRVPLVIASPWSRGGYVCSQVFDHTSPLQFLEKFLTRKLGKTVAEPNISLWRRTVCGDLTASFRPYNGEKIPLPPFLDRDAFAESIYKAKYKPAPGGFKALTESEIQTAKNSSGSFQEMPKQEPGSRPACALPYDLLVDGAINSASKKFEVTFAAKTEKFGQSSAGAPFKVYAPLGHRPVGGGDALERCRAWDFAVIAGTTIKYDWDPSDFEDGSVFLRVYGPNGFHREFRSGKNPGVKVRGENAPGRRLKLVLANLSQSQEAQVEIIDNAYGAGTMLQSISSGGQKTVELDLSGSLGWYDVSIRVQSESNFSARYAGRVEDGRESLSDPLIGRLA